MKSVVIRVEALGINNNDENLYRLQFADNIETGETISKLTSASLKVRFKIDTD